jgi:hypothetical integral membrane protein (TIGR02206 family)
MISPHPFRLFGPSHLAVLGITAAVTAGLVLWARRARGASSARAGGAMGAGSGDAGTARRIAWCLAGLLLLAEAAVVALAARADPASLKDHLPFQLCDWVIFACVAALLWRRRLAYELAYFWGLSGTLQALLTPDLAEDFPSLHFLSFQTLHAAVIVAVLYLTLGLGMRPRPRSILRAWLWLQAYVAVTAVIDWLLDSNYGYLLRKPVQASLLDYLGPWPVYLLSVEALALALFLACYAPFALLDRLRRGEGTPIPPPRGPGMAAREGTTGWYEIVVEGDPVSWQRLLAEQEAASGQRALRGSEIPLRPEAPGEGLPASPDARTRHLALAPGALARALATALAAPATTGSGAQPCLRLERLREVTGGRFDFSVEAFAESFAEQIRALLAAPPPGVEVRTFREEGPEDAAAGGPGAVELFAPVHCKAYRAWGTVTGTVPGLMDMHRRLHSLPFVYEGKIELAAHRLDPADLEPASGTCRVSTLDVRPLARSGEDAEEET